MITVMIKNRPGLCPLAGLIQGRLTALILSVVLGLGVAQAWAENIEAEPGAPTAREAAPPAPVFTFNDVEQIARERAQKAYERPENPARDFLTAIGEADWNSIRYKDDQRLWHDEGLPFEVSFFHPGFIYNNIIALDLVEDGRVTSLPFNSGLFEYGNAELAEKSAEKRLGFSGFRLHFPLNRLDHKDEAVVFLGATHFRALARHTTYGLMARGLILNPAMPEGEEYPYFRRFWLVKPGPEDASLTIYALMESPSLTGAFRYVVKPGLSTVMDVSARLYPRAGQSWPRKIGLAPLNSMYLFGEKEGGSRADYRPEVHSSDALLWTSGENRWFRRPLNNPGRLESHYIGLRHPRGFGLVQEDSNFDHYQDLRRRFDRRPSVWVEPLGEWGPGQLELIEIPGDQDIHDNIIAFWTPAWPTSTAGNAGQPMIYDYRMYWMAPQTTPHQLGRVVATRLALDQKNAQARFVIDFESEELNAIPAETGLSSQVETPAEFPVISKSLVKNTVTGGWRLEFLIKAPQENGVVQSLISARGDHRVPRFWAFLKKGENLPEPLTETWVYDFSY